MESIARRSLSVEDRFWERVQKTDTCWLWTGGLNEWGYGLFGPRRNLKYRAHRYSYQLAYGPIPEGMEIDHVKARGCTNRHCVNPAHLEAVTPRENTLRSSNNAAENARKTHCVHGHPLTNDNLLERARNGGVRRVCRTCQRHYDRAYKARKRVVALALRIG